MGLMESIFGLFSDAKDLASEAIEDPDLRNKLNAKIDEVQQAVYVAELQTKTIPWVDALHKLSRPIISLTTVIVAGVVVTLNPDIDIVKLLSGGGVGMAYTLIKGKGN